MMYSTSFQEKSLKGMKMGQRKGKKPTQKQIHRGRVQNFYYSTVYYFLSLLFLYYFVISVKLYSAFSEAEKLKYLQNCIARECH